MNVKSSCRLSRCSDFKLYSEAEINFLKKKSNCRCQNAVIFIREYCDEIEFK